MAGHVPVAGPWWFQLPSIPLPGPPVVGFIAISTSPLTRPRQVWVAGSHSWSWTPVVPGEGPVLKESAGGSGGWREGMRVRCPTQPKMDVLTSELNEEERQNQNGTERNRKEGGRHG